MDLNVKVNKKNFFSATSKKSTKGFIESMKDNAPKFGFLVHEVVDMKKLYESYGINVADNFEMYSVTLCSPQKSYKSITRNPERNAIILEQKQIVIYDNNGITTINYLPLPKEFVKEVLPEDEQFSESLYESCQKRIKIIEVSK